MTAEFFKSHSATDLASLHCKFKRSVSAPKCQISPETPGADAFHCGAISVTAGTKGTTLENRNSPQRDPIWLMVPAQSQ